MHDIYRTIELGRFREALTSVRSSPRDPTLSGDEYDVVTAELLERTGRPHEACQFAKRVLARTAIPKSLHARALIVLGTISHDGGNRALAVEHLNTALTLAEGARATKESAWARLRLLLVLADTSSPESLAGYLRDVRRAVMRLGDTAMTVSLHLSVGETETRRGALESASRHLRVASALLSGHHNEWLEGLAEIDASCLAYLLSDPDEARLRAEKAMQRIAISGHSKSYLAAVSNLAHIDLAQNRLTLAARNLNHAWELVGHNVHARVGVLDGLAQLELARGRFAEAGELLERAFDAPLDELSYCKLWTERTRVRLALATGETAEAHGFATRALSHAAIVGDRSLIKLLSLLRAEARISLGDLAGAAEDIVQAAPPEDEPPLEILAEIHRVIGKALVCEGDPVGARAAFQRSARIFRGIGHLRAQSEVEAEAAWMSRGRQVTARRGSAARTPGDSHIDAGDARADLLLRQATAIIEQGGRPDLLGSEVLALVMSAGCASAAAVVSTQAGRAAIVEERFGLDRCRSARRCRCTNPARSASGVLA